MFNLPSRAILTGIVGLVGIALLLGGSADAATKKKKAAPVSRSAIVAGKDAELIIDGKTGKVFLSSNANVERHPASLTKMMTLYLLFEALRKGQVTLATNMPVSDHAAAQKPTKLGLPVGDWIPVEVAIKAIVVRSANDIAVVIAEYLGGSEANFATQMTQKARELGMKRTYYHNASGLPDPLQISTAEDLALLARHLHDDFPEYYAYFATPEFSYRGYTYQTHDNLIGRYDGTDGIKTGYTVASGFNLVSSVVRGNNHLIGVVLGGRTAQARDNEMKKILDQTYAQLQGGPAAQNVAQADTSTPFEAAPQAAKPVNMLAALALKPAAPETDDEDSAEARRDDGSAPKIFVKKAIPRPSQKPVALAALNAPPTPAQKPLVIAAYQQPANKPALRPQATQDLGEGDIGGGAARSPVVTAQAGWTIQIGAFNDLTQARNQLANYAEKSMDVLGQAARIVMPFQAVDGHTLYRARFGPFAEREAREVCSRLTARGQTCFATVAAR